MRPVVSNKSSQSNINPNADQGMEARVRRAVARLFDEDVARRAELHNLGGHASLRIYWRVQLPANLAADQTAAPRKPARGEFTRMAMVLPLTDAFRSEEGMSQTPAATDELPFINMQRYLVDIGMPVPEIDRVDMDLGVLLLEDLGDRTFEDMIEEVRRDRELSAAEHQDAFLGLYREAIDLLVEFQQAVLNSRNASNTAGGSHDCIAFGRRFDRDLLRWELDHYLEWGLEARLQGDEAARVAARRDELGAAFERVVDRLLELPQTLVLRDYQSRNLMHKAGAWQIIDFQDALIGPFIYDLVALLRDSYIELSSAQVDELLGYYITRGARAALPWCADEDAAVEAFHLQTIQRKLKDAGRFINIDRVKGNPSFLPYYDSSIRYVYEAVHRLAGFTELAAILREVEPSWPE
jgi:aminoglycoside/choline kinase family phosphotransferase